MCQVPAPAVRAAARIFARGVDRQRLDRGVCMPTRALVPIEDLGARFLLGDPEVVVVRVVVHRRELPAGKRPTEDVPEVPRLPDGQMLDQTQQVGPAPRNNLPT
jgi:hypothetical protein